jgi:deoxycytidylate deaminase
MKMKLSAIIFDKKKIYGYGYNYKIKMGANSREYEHSIHAEMMALSKALHRNKDVREATIIVYRENSNGIANSKPCNTCKRILKKHGIKRFIYIYSDVWVTDYFK